MNSHLNIYSTKDEVEKKWMSETYPDSHPIWEEDSDEYDVWEKIYEEFGDTVWGEYVETTQDKDIRDGLKTR